MSKLGNAVKEHRMKSGLSQSELAKIAGVGKTVVFDIEHGKESVRMNTLIKILRILNMKLEIKTPLMGKITLE